MRNLLCRSLYIVATATVVAGCSNSNSAAPREVHPDNWQLLHRSATSVSTFAVDCGGCHVVRDLPGPAEPPSCFSVSFEGVGCHANGPGTAPHPLDGSFRDGSVHGKVAKADLTVCQVCHSSNPTGGPGSNPRFDVGIDGSGCEGCHGPNLAHATPWAGPNSRFHYSAGNIQAACTLCHGVALDGVGGVGINCKKCHAETTDFTLNCSACHGFPPNAVSPEPGVIAEGGIRVNHTKVPLDSHDQCATCHGVKNSGAGVTGNLNPSANYRAFDKTTDTIGDHWNGMINMNGPTGTGAGYNQTNFGCDAACHSNAGHRLSDSALPVAFGDYGSGGGAPHAVGNGWLLKSQHATEAVANLNFCLGCHTQTSAQGGISPACQDCHTVAPKMDLSNNGCSSCHHAPPDGVNPGAAKPNRAGKHGEHVGFTPATGDCSACHLGGGTNSLTHFDRTTQTTPNYPAEVNFLAAYNAKSGGATYNAAAQTCSKVSCHGGNPTPNWYTGSLPAASTAATSNTYCLSCHTFGTGEYNGFFSGQHDKHVLEQNYLCVVCHNTTVLQNGVGGNSHWSGLGTPGFELAPALTVGGGTTSVVYNGTNCTVSCHGNTPWLD